MTSRRCLLRRRAWTTIRQPLEEYGAASPPAFVLSRIRNQQEYGDQVAVEPALHGARIHTGTIVDPT